MQYQSILRNLEIKEQDGSQSFLILTFERASFLVYTLLDEF